MTQKIEQWMRNASSAICKAWDIDSSGVEWGAEIIASHAPSDEQCPICGSASRDIRLPRKWTDPGAGLYCTCTWHAPSEAAAQPMRCEIETLRDCTCGIGKEVWLGAHKVSCEYAEDRSKQLQAEIEHNDH